MSLKGLSYPFCRIKGHSGHLRRTNLIQSILFLYSTYVLIPIFRDGMYGLTKPNTPLLCRLKEPTLDFSPELSEEGSNMISKVIVEIYNASRVSVVNRMKKNYIYEEIEVLDQGNEICMKFIPNNLGQT